MRLISSSSSSRRVGLWFDYMQTHHKGMRERTVRPNLFKVVIRARLIIERPSREVDIILYTVVNVYDREREPIKTRDREKGKTIC